MSFPALRRDDADMHRVTWSMLIANVHTSYDSALLLQQTCCQR